MKIIVTGSLGHISKPLTKELIQKGHSVTVISSNRERQNEIEALGAKAAIGKLEDVEFLSTIFTGSAAVYTMEPPPDFFNKNIDYLSHFSQLANNYAEAIQQSGVKRVVHLSSIGAHTDKGNGMLAFHFEVEKILNKLSSDVSITFMRPVGFYYNLFSSIPGIKAQNAIVSNYGNISEPWVAPSDIAEAIAEEIVKDSHGRKVLYVASDEVSCDDIASTLGVAIGKKDLKWMVIPDEQILNGMVSAGMNEGIAKGLVEMNAGRRNGVLYEDYYRNRPALGKVKLKEFAVEFATVYNQQ